MLPAEVGSKGTWVGGWGKAHLGRPTGMHSTAGLAQASIPPNRPVLTTHLFCL